MNKTATTIEQSKQLINLGIDESTADMHWFPKLGFLATDHSDKKREAYEQKGLEYVPAWSLSALLTVIPNITVNKVVNSEWKGLYSASYNDANGVLEYSCNYYDNPFDAAFDVVYYYLSTKYLTTIKTNDNGR